MTNLVALAALWVAFVAVNAGILVGVLAVTVAA